MKVISFNIKNNITNITKILPILSNNCNIIFKSLIYFQYHEYIINNEILNNIHNNIDKMSKVKRIRLEFISLDIDEKNYIKFIQKLLSLKLETILLRANNYLFYSIEELKEISHKINCLDLNTIFIAKLK